MIVRILFPILSLIACGLVFWWWLCTVKLGTRARAIVLMGLLLCASKFICFAAFGGDSFVPELPEKLIWFWNWAHAGLVVLLFLLPPAHLVRWAVRRFAGRACPRAVWLSVLPLLAWGIAARGVYNGLRVPEIEEVTIECENLPEELDGYRILQISDIHASPAARRWRTEAIVARANAAGADLICLTGDYADGQSVRQYRNIEPLRELRAPDGVLAVSGNHEYYFDTLAWWMRYQRMTNITFLENACVAPRPGLVVGGVSDPRCQLFGFDAPDPDAAFATATNGAFRILLQHRPYVNYESECGKTPETSWNLQLSGHTHGGIMPPLYPLVYVFNKGLVKGSYEGVRAERDALHVSTGAGQWAGFPLRFTNDATLTLITLRKKPRP